MAPRYKEDRQFRDGDGFVDDDEHGNVTRFIPPHGHAHEFAYTAREALFSHDPPDVAGVPDLEIERSEYRPGGSLARRGFANGAELETQVDSATGFLENVTVTSHVSPSGVTMPTDVNFVEVDEGGRPELIETTMGDMSFAWDGPVLTTEVWHLVDDVGVEHGVAGSVHRTVGASMLLKAESARIGSAGLRIRQMDSVPS